MLNEKVLVDKISLASYICNSYKSKYNSTITPIKLQKGLYFLFAMWGGKIMAARGESETDTEDDDLYGKRNEYLFNANFEAWKYGPVDREIYEWYKNGSNINNISEINFINDVDYKEDVKQYIDETIERVFITSDFGLVDMSHEDQVWKDASRTESKHMKNEEILLEYASRC